MLPQRSARDQGAFPYVFAANILASRCTCSGPLTTNGFVQCKQQLRLYNGIHSGARGWVWMQQRQHERRLLRPGLHAQRALHKDALYTVSYFPLCSVPRPSA